LDIVRTIPDLRGHIAGWRNAGERIGLVPTMGALHEGHLALVRAAGDGCDRVAATIFVNPKQFAPNEDLAAYPRREAADLDMLRSAGVAVVFMPTVAEVYPPGFATTVQVAGLTDCLCGAHRAGHFDGVATVVTKLLLQSLPDITYFGEKDYQQLMVVRRLARDLDIPVADRGCADRTRGQRARLVVAQRLPLAGGTPRRSRTRPDIAADCRHIGSRAGSDRARDRARHHRPRRGRVHGRIFRNPRSRGLGAGNRDGRGTSACVRRRPSRPHPTDRQLADRDCYVVSRLLAMTKVAAVIASAAKQSRRIQANLSQ